jgi:hypothetical protein
MEVASEMDHKQQSFRLFATAGGGGSQHLELAPDRGCHTDPGASAGLVEAVARGAQWNIDEMPACSLFPLLPNVVGPGR